MPALHSTTAIAVIIWMTGVMQEYPHNELMSASAAVSLHDMLILCDNACDPVVGSIKVKMYDGMPNARRNSSAIVAVATVVSMNTTV